MADIVLKYKGLTGTLTDITIDNGQTMAQLLTAIASDEGLTASYYNISLYRDPSITEATSGTLASKSIITGDTIICTPDQSGNLEERQIQKLDIAATKRSEAYDINKLPTKYSGNSVVDNANTGGLQERRPWIIDYSRVMSGMVLWLDAGDTDSYPGTGTTWTDLTNPANNGTLIGNITYTADDGGALVFPNPNTGVGTSYVRMNRVTEFMPTTGLTVEQWLSPDDWLPAAGRQTISNTEAGGYAMSIRTGGIDFIVLLNGVYRNARLTDASGLSGWVHLVGTCDGRFVKLYVNGVDTLTGNNDAGATYPITYHPSNGLFIGAEAGASATVPNTIQSYEGKMGTTAIYNRALTAAEVLKNYRSDKSRFGL
jgi:hypothetical protein